MGRSYDNNDEDEIVIEKHHHHWKMRLIITLVMLVFSFVGLIFSDIQQNGAWNYWRFMIPLFAALSTFLSWYLKKNKSALSKLTIWHELIHWLGLALAVYLISIFLHIGLMGRFEAGLVILVMLGLTTFLAGIYIEPTFCIIGLLMGVFSIAAALLASYIYTIMLPLTIAVAVFLVWVARKRF